MEKEILNNFKDKLSMFIDTENINIDKLYEELLNIFSENEEEFIIRRHNELMKSGYKNKEIYPIIINEVSNSLFKGRTLSERQIKRFIYGD